MIFGLIGFACSKGNNFSAAPVLFGAATAVQLAAWCRYSPYPAWFWGDALNISAAVNYLFACVQACRAADEARAAAVQARNQQPMTGIQTVVSPPVAQPVAYVAQPVAQPV